VRGGQKEEEEEEEEGEMAEGLIKWQKEPARA